MQNTTNFPKLAQPALRALKNAGYTELKQLTNVSDEELLALHGMGPNALKVIRQALKELDSK